MHSRRFDLGSVVVDNPATYHKIDGVDLEGASQIWVIGTVAWSGATSYNFEAGLSSSLGGLIIRSPLWHEPDQNVTVQVSMKADVSSVPSDDLYLRVWGFQSSATLTLDMAAVVTYG